MKSRIQLILRPITKLTVIALFLNLGLIAPIKPSQAQTTSPFVPETQTPGVNTPASSGSL